MLVSQFLQKKGFCVTKTPKIHLNHQFHIWVTVSSKWLPPKSFIRTIGNLRFQKSLKRAHSNNHFFKARQVCKLKFFNKVRNAPINITNNPCQMAKLKVFCNTCWHLCKMWHHHVKGFDHSLGVSVFAIRIP